MSELVALIGWPAAAGENPDVPGPSVALAVGVLRFGCSRGAGSPGADGAGLGWLL